MRKSFLEYIFIIQFKIYTYSQPIFKIYLDSLGKELLSVFVL